MFKDNKFAVMAGSKEIVCDVLFTYHSEQTGKDYVAFTDHSKAPDGSASVFYATYDPNAESIDLVPIQTQGEWTMLREMFEQIQEDAAREMVTQFHQAMGAGGEEKPEETEEKAE